MIKGIPAAKSAITIGSTNGLPIAFTIAFTIGLMMSGMCLFNVSEVSADLKVAENEDGDTCYVPQDDAIVRSESKSPSSSNSDESSPPKPQKITDKELSRAVMVLQADKTLKTVEVFPETHIPSDVKWK